MRSLGLVSMVVRAKERLVPPEAFDKAAKLSRSRSLERVAREIQCRYGERLWDRLSAEVRREVDSLVSAGRNVQAIALMREHAGLPTPRLHDCVDAAGQRFSVLRHRPASS